MANKLLIVIPAFGLMIGLAACRHNAHEASPAAETKTAEVKQPLYYCPMHPTYTSDKPGDCPICFMKLVPMESEEEKEAPATGSAAPGLSAVKISAERRQLIGVKTARVEMRRLVAHVRAAGRVAYDPDLYTAIREHQELLRSSAAAGKGQRADLQEEAGRLLRASSLRLRQLGLSPAQIEDIGTDSGGAANLLVGGDRVWVYAQIYEHEAGLVKPGQTMAVESPSDPGRIHEGKIVSVDPVLDRETRTLRARALIDNPEGLLKPEMYVDASIHAELGEKLAIPKPALIDTGTRQVVFVDKGNGELEPREIRIGREAEGFYEVLSGLTAGESVVAAGNFLVDSESRLKAAFSKMSEGPRTDKGNEQPAHKH